MFWESSHEWTPLIPKPLPCTLRETWTCSTPFPEPPASILPQEGQGVLKLTILFLISKYKLGGLTRIEHSFLPLAIILLIFQAVHFSREIKSLCAEFTLHQTHQNVAFKAPLKS